MAEKVNLITNGTGKSIFNENTKPSDLYYYISEKVKERVESITLLGSIETKDDSIKDLIWNEEKRDLIIASCQKWLKVNLTRKLIKTNVMVKAYNASILSRADYLKDLFETIYEKEDKGYNYLYKSEEGIILKNYDFLYHFYIFPIFFFSFFLILYFINFLKYFPK